MSEARPQTDDFRVEHDSMGEVRVPARAKWRAQTQRAVDNFPISGRPIERELIRGLALIKGFGARVRAERIPIQWVEVLHRTLAIGLLTDDEATTVVLNGGCKNFRSGRTEAIN